MGPAATTAARQPFPSDAASVLQRDFLDRQPLLATVNLIIAAITASALLGVAAHAAVLAWFAAMLVVQIVRAGLWWTLRAAPSRSRMRK